MTVRHPGMEYWLSECRVQLLVEAVARGITPEERAEGNLHRDAINRRLRLQPIVAEPKATWWLGAIIFQFFSSIYGGYFGAGNGILMLAAMGFLGLHDIHRANGIKNFLGVCLNSTAVLSFALMGLVRWPEALMMAVGALAGGYFGASMAVRVGQTWVRRGVVAIGFVIFFAMVWKLNQ